MRTSLVVVFLLSLGTIAVRAEIEPVAIEIFQGTGTNQSYTVPTGKVLLIEHLQMMSPTNATIAPILRVSCTSASLTFMPVTWRVDNTQDIWIHDSVMYAYCTLEKPIKVGGNCVLHTFNSDQSVRNTIHISGLLVDPSDLYASIGSQIERFALSDNTMDMLLHLQSSRPAHVRAERSTDLVAWKEAMDTIISRTSNTDEREASVAPLATKEFFRFHVRPK